MIRRLRHGKIDLALHALRDTGSGRPLLLLHGRGQRSPATVPDAVATWPGPIFALDFTGHGASTVPKGGGYSVEILMADADHALAEVGSATLLGRGLGAYVALLLAGSRPKEVRGAILCDGPGLSGGGPRPVTPTVVVPTDVGRGAPDPFALLELARDVRPPDYAKSFVRQCVQLSGIDRPISACGAERPDWLAAVIEKPGVAVTSLAEALDYYARIDA